MFRRNYFTFLLAIALFTTAGTAVFAQSGMARGTVLVKKADGSVAPVADAVIDVYRTDIKGKLPSAKTNKKGEFTVLGLLPGGRYLLSISAPGIRSDLASGIKAGDERIVVNAIEGDGKPFSEEEARNLINKAAATNQSTNQPAKELTAAQKKEQEELIKKNEQITANNKKVENINAVVNRTLKEGNEQFNAGNYDGAIAKYDEGINADPDFAGTASILLNNKASALVKRAIAKYNTAIKGDPANIKTAMEPVKKDLIDSVSASNRSLELMKSDTPSDPAAQKRAVLEKNRAYANLLDGYSRMVGMNIDSTKGKDALLILEEYSASETDVAQKSKTHLILAESLSRSGDLTNSVVVYRKILETSPDNPDALGGLGLSLVGLGSGATPINTAMVQEGLNLMQRFTEVAPDTHPLKADVKSAVDYLKTQQLTPQKTTKSTTKKKT